MADSIQGGYLRGAKTGALGYGPLVVTGADSAAVATSSAPVTGAVFSAGAPLIPKFKVANVAASATNSTVIAAVTGKKLRVLAAAFVAGDTATALTFGSAASAAISCLFANAANGGASLAFSPTGWFETVAGEALTATTGTGSTTGIQLVYIEV